MKLWLVLDSSEIPGMKKLFASKVDRIYHLWLWLYSFQASVHSWIDTLKLIFRTSQRSETETPKKKKSESCGKGAPPQHGPKKRTKNMPQESRSKLRRCCRVPGFQCGHCRSVHPWGSPPGSRNSPWPYFPLPNGRPPDQPPPYQSTWWNTHLLPTRPGPELNRDSDILPETTHLPQKGISMTFYSLCTGQGVSHSCHENKTQDP